MKIFHTADWHIGQKLYNKDRYEEFNLFFDWIINEINKQSIDLLIIAGDIFDVGHPSNSALHQYYQFLHRIQNTTCKSIIIIGGNHDSVGTLNAPKEVLKFLNVHVVGGAPENSDDLIIKIYSESKSLELVVCAIPYLRDKDIRKSTTGESYEERVEAIREGIINYYNSIGEKIRQYKDQNIPVIATGHLFATGVSTSDSERNLHIGNLGNINANQFPEIFDYIALGHIHRQQIVGKNEYIRYSGSPLPLSFSEQKDTKYIIKLETADGKIAPIEKMKVPEFRKLISFNGSYSEVVSKIDEYASSSELTDWAEINIEEEKHDPTIITKLEKFLEDITQIEILKYRLQYKDQPAGADQLYEETVSLKDMPITEVFMKKLDAEGTNNKIELEQTFNELLEIMDI